MKINIPWSDGFEFAFQGKKITSTLNKEVYLGCFIGDAPPGLETGMEYCLKVITPPEDHLLQWPQEREYFDLLSYKGTHLRQILARNQAAEQVASQLMNTGDYHPDPADIYVTVEPVYHVIYPEKYSVLERLKIIHQVALGCLELYENKVGSKGIRAIRDLKNNNILIDAEGIVKLIDFASVKLEEDSSVIQIHNKEEAGGTHAAIMSTGNTAPENVSSVFGTIGQATDVFSIGSLLGEYFLLDNKNNFKNPVQLWVREWGSNSQTLKKAYQHALAKTGDVTGSWLLTLLEEQHNECLRWDPALDKVTEQVEALFCEATHIEAGKRITMKEFIASLQMIITACDCDSQEETSLLIVDRTNLNAMMIKSWMKEANIIKFPALCAVVTRTENIEHEADQTPELLREAKDLEAYLGSLVGCTGTEYSNYLFGLYSLYTELFKRKGSFLFSGRVYVFESSLPNGVKPLSLETGEHTTSEMTLSLASLSADHSVEIHVMSIENPYDLYGKDSTWHAVTDASIPTSIQSEVKKEPSRTGIGLYGHYIRIGSKYYYSLTQLKKEEEE